MKADELLTELKTNEVFKAALESLPDAQRTIAESLSCRLVGDIARSVIEPLSEIASDREKMRELKAELDKLRAAPSGKKEA